MCFDFFKGLRGTNFLCRGENKNVQLETLAVYTRPLWMGVRSLPAKTKNPRYGPASSAWPLNVGSQDWLEEFEETTFIGV